MSARIVCIVECDGCGREAQSHNEHRSGIFRDELAKVGWKVLWSDLCPQCVADGVEP